MEPTNYPPVLQYSRQRPNRRWRAVLLAVGFAIMGCLLMWKREHSSYSSVHYVPLTQGM